MDTLGSEWEEFGIVSTATILRFLQNGGNFLITVKFFAFKERLYYSVFV
jgi:hypothetical protein